MLATSDWRAASCSTTRVAKSGAWATTCSRSSRTRSLRGCPARLPGCGCPGYACSIITAGSHLCTASCNRRNRRNRRNHNRTHGWRRSVWMRMHTCLRKAGSVLPIDVPMRERCAAAVWAHGPARWPEALLHHTFMQGGAIHAYWPTWHSSNFFQHAAPPRACTCI